MIVHGVAATTNPVYGDVVLADCTLPFNENDVTYFVPLYIQTVAMLNAFPIHIAADAAYDSWYAYQTCARRGGIAAIALNQHAHPIYERDPDGTPKATAVRCSFLCRQDRPVTTSSFSKGKAVSKVPKDINLEAGGLMRLTLDREGPLYQAIYHQRTSCERINSQAKNLGIERPKATELP